MSTARWVALLASIAAGLTACATHRSRLIQAPGEDLVVLLPNADGSVGRIEVSNSSGKAQLDSARAATVIARGAAPGEVAPLDNADVKQLFDEALGALPRAAEHFTLYFQFDSDELTDESRALLPTIQKSVKSRAFPEVAVIGHTDTVGAAAGNDQLGLKRAEMVRRLLIAGGLDASLVESTSHGEKDLLVQTADDVAEPRNRRVEVSVR